MQPTTWLVAIHLPRRDWLSSLSCLLPSLLQSLLVRQVQSRRSIMASLFWYLSQLVSVPNHWLWLLMLFIMYYIRPVIYDAADWSIAEWYDRILRCSSRCKGERTCFKPSWSPTDATFSYPIARTPLQAWLSVGEEPKSLVPSSTAPSWSL